MSLFGAEGLTTLEERQTVNNYQSKHDFIEQFYEMENRFKGYVIIFCSKYKMSAIVL